MVESKIDLNFGIHFNTQDSMYESTCKSITTHLERKINYLRVQARRRNGGEINTNFEPLSFEEKVEQAKSKILHSISQGSPIQMEDKKMASRRIIINPVKEPPRKTSVALSMFSEFKRNLQKEHELATILDKPVELNVE